MTKRLILTYLTGLTMGFGGAAMADSSTYGVAALPPEMLRQPAAETCPALRSGIYRLITPTLGGRMSDQTGKSVLDAARLEFTHSDGSRSHWEAKGNCRFTDLGGNGYSVDYVVSQAGVLVGRVSVNGGSSNRMAFGFPEQTHALEELAGTWNTLGLRYAPERFYAEGGHLTFNRWGATNAATVCNNPDSWAIDACTVVAPPALAGIGPYVPDSGGGFTHKSDSRTSRLFLYRAAAGLAMLAGIDSEGSFFLGTTSAAMEMPPVGRTATAWNLDMTGRLESATSTYVNTNTVVSVDLRQKTWTRNKKNAGVPDEHIEPMLADRPRPGYFTRLGGDGPTPNGSTIHFNEFIALYLPGMGVFPALLPTIKLFEISVLQP